MSTTTIKRKALRNRVRAKQRKSSIKRLTSKPTLKNIDIEEIKATFTKKTTKKEAPKPEKSTSDTTLKQEKQVVETKASPKTEAKVEKTEAKKEKAEAKEQVKAKEKTEATEKAEAKVEKTKEEKSESVKSTDKKSPKATKKPVAKKTKE